MSDSRYAWLSAIVASGLHGASVVYHRIVAIEGEVTQWTATNPAIGALIAEGEAVAVSMLTAVGVPVPVLEAMTSAVMSGLSQLAAADPSVVSGGKAAHAPPAPTPPAVMSGLSQLAAADPSVVSGGKAAHAPPAPTPPLAIAAAT